MIFLKLFLLPNSDYPSKEKKEFPLPFFIAFLVFICGCTVSPSFNKSEINNSVVKVLMTQQENWNLGDVEAYMDGYLHSDSLRFASGGKVSYSWQKTFEGYKKGYPDKASMGELSFTDLDVNVISADAALVFGKWELTRDGDHPWGLFTLLFRKTDQSWKIVCDHTSSGDI